MNNPETAYNAKRTLGRALSAVLVAALLALGWNGIQTRFAPFGQLMRPANGSTTVDPRENVVLEAVGIGTQLTEIEVHEEDGKVLAKARNIDQFKLGTPLEFGKHYTVTVTAERPWLGQKQTDVLSFSTVSIPVLEGAADRSLEPDASVTLKFDQPVGKLETAGELPLTVQPDTAPNTFKLLAHGYAQGKTYSTQIRWETVTGVPLPPFELRISTPAAISAAVNLRSAENLGTAMPLQITFSEPLAERENAGRPVRILTQDGKEIAGRWGWVGKTRLQFTPLNGWPPSNAIRVSADPGAFRNAQGGFLEPPLDLSFTTGTDRKIVVYLDTQTMVAMENGQAVRSFKVSTGKPKTPTVTGSFYIYARFPIKTMKSRAKKGEKGHYIVENVPYAQYFYSDYAFHGAWWHNGFGHTASHGCVNMSTHQHNVRWPNAPEDAGWLYQWASLGVPVTVMHTAPAPASTRIALDEPRREQPGLKSSPGP